MKTKMNLYVFAGVLIIAGAVFGLLLASALTHDQQQVLEQDVQQYLNFMQASPEMAGKLSVWSYFSTHIKWLLLLWLLGVTVIGLPGVLILIFVKGSILGFSMGTFIAQFGWKGIVFSAAAFGPQNIIIIPAMVIMTAGAMSYAIQFVQLRVLKQQIKESPKLIEFTTVSVVMLVMFLAAALLEAYLSPPLINWASTILVSST
ncbi:stage II sporulation protein M [Paenibacillus sp. GXUN7292]|uniref:stage II sporulation protein M n=1 Tax=Paenibacillus sp. GXUN7292 TaxID=3422499 RepID=UPI003D7CC21C